MADRYILAHDLGTSGNKAVLYDFDGKLIASRVASYETSYPETGRAEQNPEDWWRAVCLSTRELLEETGEGAGSIACVCFSGQMMGCLLLDDEGLPLRPAMIWADTRAVRQEKEMNGSVGEKEGYSITGHRLSASYSAAKLLWIRDEEPEVYRRAAKLLQAKDYIVYRMTGNIVTDYSDASGTNLLDIGEKRWSEQLIRQFGLRRELLPDIYPSTAKVGTVSAGAARQTGLLEGTPVILGGGDGSCACVGAGVVREGKTYGILGSSSWISTVSRKPYLEEGRRTFNWIHLDPEYYTPCGTMQAAGLSLQWYKDTLAAEEGNPGGTSVYRLLNEQAMRSVPGAGGLLFLPYLLGERSPRWDTRARGCYIGLSMGTSREDMVRAVLEGVGYNLKTIMDILEKKISIEEVTVIGGGARGEGWLQILADIWEKPLSVPLYLEEATSMGAAVCGGVGIGVFDNFQVMESLNPTNKRIEPNGKNAGVYRRMHRAFESAYEGLRETFPLL